MDYLNAEIHGKTGKQFEEIIETTYAHDTFPRCNIFINCRAVVLNIFQLLFILIKMRKGI